MKMLRIIWVMAVAACAATAADKSTVLKAARMFDGTRITAPGVVVVTGTRITAVGASAGIPPGAEIVELGDATLSPGFIDAHTHITLGSESDYRQMLIDGLQRTVAEKALRTTADAERHC